MPRGKNKENAEKRFRKFIYNIPTAEPVEYPCWGWTGGHDKAGYPCFWHLGQSMRAYRASYLIFNKEEPTGEIVRTCGYKYCCQVAHLTDKISL